MRPFGPTVDAQGAFRSFAHRLSLQTDRYGEDPVLGPARRTMGLLFNPTRGNGLRYAVQEVLLSYSRTRWAP